MPKGQPNIHLKYAREQRNWSQAELAAHLGGIDAGTVSRWERGSTRPGPFSRQKLCEVLGKTAAELGLLEDTPESPAQGALPAINNIPYRKNLFFTDREELLDRLYEVFRRRRRAALVQAISGLGGVGKTHLALEFAYRYGHSYQALLWVNASSQATLLTEFAGLATTLALPVQQTENQQQLIATIKGWLREHTKWLLIFDDAVNVEMVSDFAASLGKGHILLTTRSQSVGEGAHRLEIAPLSPEEGALLLLRRTRQLEPQDSLAAAETNETRQAMELSAALGGLPLALDQAAAYIEETECGIGGYLERYQKYRHSLLGQRGRPPLRSTPPEHPEPVAMTLALSVEQAQKAHPAAAELLTFCAFLQPEAIPLEILLEGAGELSPVLQHIASHELDLDAAIHALRIFSLLRRHPDTNVLTIHPLAQAVLVDKMPEETQRLWATRIVRAVNRTFPEVTFATWPRCRRVLPHALVCATSITRWQMTFPEAARLVDQAGVYLRDLALFAQAEALQKQALALHEQTSGSESLEVAQSLQNLAKLYYEWGDYERAEQPCQQALALRERILGPEAVEVAQSLDVLADIYIEHGKYELAEAHFNRALGIFEQALGSEHVQVARTLDNLAVLYDSQGRYHQSEALYQRVLSIYQQAPEGHQLDIAKCLNNLGWLYSAQGKLAQAEPPLHQAFKIRRNALGAHHPEVAITLNLLATLYHTQVKYSQAESCYKKVLSIRKQIFGPRHPDVAATFRQGAELYRLQGKYTEAEALQKQALAIREQTLEPHHRDIAQSLNYLGRVYCAQGNYPEAERLYQRALTIRTQTLGKKHPSTAIVLNDLADLYRLQGHDEQATPLYEQAMAIIEPVLGRNHLHMAVSLHGQAAMYAAQGKYQQADELYQRVLAIRDLLGPNHPDVVQVRESYASLRQKMGQPDKRTDADEHPEQEQDK